MEDGKLRIENGRKGWTMAKGDDLQERFGRLAAAIILLCRNIPKELNETIQWLQVGIWSEIWSREEVAGILEECTILARITAASINTVKKRVAGMSTQSS